MKRLVTYSFSGALSLALIACSGKPDIDQVKADFESPSGSIDDRDGVMASNGAREGSGPLTSVAGGGVPGASLTGAGKSLGLYEMNIRRAWDPKIRMTREFVAGRVTRQALSEAQFNASGCENDAAAQEAFDEVLRELYADLILGKSRITGKASYTLDLTSCSNGALEGSARVTLEVIAEDRGDGDGYFAFKLDYALTNVCELQTEALACLDGTLLMEAEGEGMDSFGALRYTSAWEADASWKDNGVDKAGYMKGGLRVVAQGSGNNDGSLVIEYLNYVNVNGVERSYVWSLEANAEMITWKCRGANGERSCTITEGNWSCMGPNGSAMLTWTVDDQAGIDAEFYAVKN